MTYAVKEIFYTLQGEGANTGRPAVFCRFAGCNLWTGREEDRAERHLPVLRHRVRRHRRPRRRQVRHGGRARGAVAGGLARRATGGRPLRGLHRRRAAAPARPAAARGAARGAASRSRSRPTARSRRRPGIDWLCVSPKAGSALVVRRGRRAQAGLSRRRAPSPSGSPALGLPPLLPPADGRAGPRGQHRARRSRYCLDHPRWRLSLQTHKLLGIP